MNFERLTTYLDELQERYGVPGSDLLVTKNQEEIYRHLTGYRDYEHKEATKENQLYRLFSATKVITMIAVMQQIEAGKIGLYDELQKFLPEYGTLYVVDESKDYGWGNWPDASAPCHLSHKPIRIIDLMTMTAGLNYNTEPPTGMSLSEDKASSGKKEAQMKGAPGETLTQKVMRAAAQMPLLFEPGTHWAYSLAHDVLAAVVEVVTGQRFSDYLEEHIIFPSGASDLTFHPNAEQEKRMAALYVSKNGTKEMLPCTDLSVLGLRMLSQFESGGGGLIGGVEGYSKVIAALANGGVTGKGERLLTEKSIHLFMTPYTSGELQLDFMKMQKFGYSYGLGVRVLTEKGSSRSPLGEFGWDGAAGAYVLIDPIHHLTIFYAQHTLAYDAVFTEVHPRIRDLVYEALED